MADGGGAGGDAQEARQALESVTDHVGPPNPLPPHIPSHPSPPPPHPPAGPYRPPSGPTPSSLEGVARLTSRWGGGGRARAQVEEKELDENRVKAALQELLDSDKEAKEAQRQRCEPAPLTSPVPPATPSSRRPPPRPCGQLHTCVCSSSGAFA